LGEVDAFSVATMSGSPYIIIECGLIKIETGTAIRLSLLDVLA
jgi:hypothetical protein